MIGHIQQFALRDLDAGYLTEFAAQRVGQPLPELHGADPDADVVIASRTAQSLRSRAD